MDGDTQASLSFCILEQRILLAEGVVLWEGSSVSVCLPLAGRGVPQGHIAMFLFGGFLASQCLSFVYFVYILQNPGHFLPLREVTQGTQSIKVTVVFYSLGMPERGY